MGRKGEKERRGGGGADREASCSIIENEGERVRGKVGGKDGM